ncbi:hypothetical protein [Micromonospora auratinigra]|uniref:hypothetical protein n=1 Tax=Micromonospora auratinigra TaxID=261654 RepID=UPI000ACE8258|nr:hypothetical protein [Micromonospora auratinigra]
MTEVLAHEAMTLGVPDALISFHEPALPTRHLTLDGVPAYQLGCSRGTCGHADERAGRGI